jgi:hypothetical protein
MKTIRMRFVQQTMAITMTGLLAVACEYTGETAFGKPCETGADCVSGFCVGGEAGGQRAPFCSDDCAGRKSGDACGDGRGKCVADFVSWCWMPCETNAECAAVNADRPVCGLMSSGGVDYPFKVCISKAKM